MLSQDTIKMVGYGFITIIPLGGVVYLVYWILKEKTDILVKSARNALIEDDPAQPTLYNPPPEGFPTDPDNYFDPDDNCPHIVPGPRREDYGRDRGVHRFRGAVRPTYVISEDDLAPMLDEVPGERDFMSPFDYMQNEA